MRIHFRIHLLSGTIGVMNAMTAKRSKEPEMKSFRIDRENNITAFAKRKDAEAAGGDTFRSEAELHELTAG